jgi:hypothetical protein
MKTILSAFACLLWAGSGFAQNAKPQAPNAVQEEKSKTPENKASQAAPPKKAEATAAGSTSTSRLAMARPIMHGLVHPVQNLLSLLAKESLSDAEYKKAHTDLLQVRAQIASMRHFSKSLGADYQKVSVSMLEDLGRVEKAIEQKKLDHLKFFLKGALQHCGTCHVKTEGKDDFAGFQGLIDSHSKLNSEWKDKLDLMINLRQFGEAVDLLDKKIADSNVSPQTLDMYNVFYTYLKINIQTKGDFSRPTNALQKYLQARGDRLPEYHRDEIKAWLASLTILGKRKDLANMTMKDCESLLAQGWQLNEEDFTQNGLIQILTASKRLQELSMESNSDKASRAQAYRLLGQVAERYADTIWYAESHSYYESAIQMLPHSEVAKAAYKNLEDLIVFENSGSAGTMIPLETQKKLEGLKKMAF